MNIQKRLQIEFEFLGEEQISANTALKIINDVFKEAETEQLTIGGVVSSSNMRKALETVVRGYESDGMENMQIRDDVFYKTCKEALKFDDNVSN